MLTYVNAEAFEGRVVDNAMGRPEIVDSRWDFWKSVGDYQGMELIRARVEWLRENDREFRVLRYRVANVRAGFSKEALLPKRFYILTLRSPEDALQRVYDDGYMKTYLPGIIVATVLLAIGAGFLAAAKRAG
jgi:hypothetical protein